MTTHTCGIFLVTRDWTTLVGKSGVQGAYTQHSIPKGKCDEGENYLQAALRELVEEGNIVIDPAQHTIHEIPPIYYSRKPKCFHGFFITGIDPEDYTDIRCNTYRGKELELTEHSWVPLKQCETLLHPTQAEAVRYIRRFLLERRL